MPGKPRQRKGKYAYQNKKQGGQTGKTVTAQTPAEASVPGGEPVAAAVASRPSPPKAAPVAPRTASTRQARAGTQTVKPSSLRVQFVGKELRTIGILAAVMLVLVFVIAKVIA